MTTPYSKSVWQLALSSPDPKEEIWRWLYKELRSAILAGRIPSGTRLPSTRLLANQLKVSRWTVVTAFQQLLDEGLTRTENGSGTYVEVDTPQRAFTVSRASSATSHKHASLSDGAATLLKEVRSSVGYRITGKAFRSCEPALDLFPRDLWGRVASRVARRAPLALYTYGNAAGYGPLRKAIAEYVGGSRGVICSPEQVVVTSGAQQGLDLIARLLLNPGDMVWVEDPGYDGARYAFRAAGAVVVPVRVDSEGIDVAAGRQAAPKARIAYVTPANQYPLGITMSKSRRADLLRWAALDGAWIVEDEFDAEYRYSGMSVASLQSQDSNGSVLYVGTFSKVLFGSLRLGFLVLPQALVEPFAKYRYATDRQVSTIDQAILSEFITEGHFGHHLQRMRVAYAERAEILSHAVTQSFGGMMTLSSPIAGMRAIGWLPPSTSDETVALKARGYGLEVASLSSFSIRHYCSPGLILGFASCQEKELLEGTEKLAQALMGIDLSAETHQSA